jgi:hypothetical protein
MHRRDRGADGRNGARGKRQRDRASGELFQPSLEQGQSMSERVSSRMYFDRDHQKSSHRPGWRLQIVLSANQVYAFR